MIGFPVSLGFGYSNIEFDYGEFIRLNPDDPASYDAYGAKDYYNAYSLGFGINYFIQLYAGFTYKNITSILTDRPIGVDSLRLSADIDAFDFGILINVPVLKLINENIKLGLDENLFAKPSLNFSIGYSKSNIGNEIFYNDQWQSDPLPRMDRIGYGISTRFDLATDDFNINAFNFSFTVEADDILIKRDSTGSEYQSTLSDLNFSNNIIQIEGDEKIVSRTGTKLEFVETFSLYFGHFSGRGYDQRKTNGYEFRLKGFLKVAALWANEPIVDFIRDHFDIRYYNTNYFADHELETKMTGLAFYVQNLNELFE